MKPSSSRNTPTILVIFGATGDLVRRKIAPTLSHLGRHGKLPKLFSVIGYSRRELTDRAFREEIDRAVRAHLTKHRTRERARFLNLFSYQQGRFETARDYETLAARLGRLDDAWRTCANKLFYLAVPPHYYETIFKHLASSGLTEPCSDEEGWTRVLVEKPFGKDFASAQKLDEMLTRLFKEEQIYRIDHYLAKEMLQGIINFRFSNNLLEPSWNNQSIEKIEIRLLETMGVEGRGAFYDGVGALRDVGQNHLLQMLALATMDHPETMEAAALRAKRAETLTKLKALSIKDEIVRGTFRAQYKGYRRTPGVSKGSDTETYFRLRAFLDTPRWQGVPIMMEAGKALGTAHKDITVTFKHPLPCLCPPGKQYQNRVVFTLEPQETITIHFWTKQPGFEARMEERQFTFFLYEKREKAQYVEEYSKLLLDCIAGDQTLFASSQEVAAMWRFIDPIVEAWQRGVVPLRSYARGASAVRREAQAHFEPVWHASQNLTREIGIVGLGKMGGNIARRLLEHGWRVVGFDRDPRSSASLAQEGSTVADSLARLADALRPPRIIWLIVPAGEAVDGVLEELVPQLARGDVVIDGGNSFYKDSVRRSKRLARRGITFVDVGVSGGPGGARYGASLMVGGTREVYERLLPLYLDLATPQGVQFFEGAGAGHFVKMIHNGIEYGMMQAIAEGFTILKHAPFALDLRNVAHVYNHGSVVASRLIGWLEQAFRLRGEELGGVSPAVAHTGEGEWTVRTAEALKLKAKVIEEAFKFRIASQETPSFTGKVLSALREQFGGHEVRTK